MQTSNPWRGGGERRRGGGAVGPSKKHRLTTLVTTEQQRFLSNWVEERRSQEFTLQSRYMHVMWMTNGEVKRGNKTACTNTVTHGQVAL